MIKNKKTIVRIVVAILLAVIWVVNSMNPLLKAINPKLHYDISMGSVLVLIGQLVIVISLFIGNFNIMAIGAVFQIIGRFSNETPIVFLVIVSYILVVIAAFISKDANKLCLIAGVIALCVCMIFNYQITNGFKITNFSYFINRLKWTIEVCLPFFAWSYIVEIKTKEYSSKSLIVENEQPISNELDQVLKLKELLDLGVINEEEFNEKKKQILNLK